MPDKNTMHPGRIRWKCRRGMLELDMMLLPFFDQHYSELNEAQQKTFDDLLDEKDPVLYLWLLGHDQPEDAELAAIVTLIIECHQDG